MPAVVDAAGLADIRILAWVDVINATVWLLVVVVLEVDVRLQEHDRFTGTALSVSNAAKFVLYGTLLLAAIYWGIKGDFIDFWDAFLWLLAFVLIELNVFQWRHEADEPVPLNPKSDSHQVTVTKRLWYGQAIRAARR